MQPMKDGDANLGYTRYYIVILNQSVTKKRIKSLRAFPVTVGIFLSLIRSLFCFFQYCRIHAGLADHLSIISAPVIVDN
jgi:hypothetical protein